MPRQAFEPGGILLIDIGGGMYMYARMLARHPKLAFYDYQTTVPVNDPRQVVRAPVLFVLAVYDDAYKKGRWPKVGYVPLAEADTPIPDQFIQNPDGGPCIIVDQSFNQRPAEPKECVGLEAAAVWTANEVEARLRDHYAGRPNNHVEYLGVRL